MVRDLVGKVSNEVSYWSLDHNRANFVEAVQYLSAVGRVRIAFGGTPQRAPAYLRLNFRASKLHRRPTEENLLEYATLYTLSNLTALHMTGQDSTDFTLTTHERTPEAAWLNRLGRFQTISRLKSTHVLATP